MISAVQGFASRNRRSLMITAGITGGIYLMGKYAKSKLIEFHEKSASERTANENMKRRFQQNQQDCVFTVLSLLPILGDQLLHELNVELIASRLQQSRSQRSMPLSTSNNMPLLPRPPNNSEEDTRAVTAMPGPFIADGSDQNSQDVKDKEQNDAAERAETDARNIATTSGVTPDDNRTPSEAGDGLTQENTIASESMPGINIQDREQDDNSAAIERRAKRELWNELKVMSFTRTITALYSVTFLTLLTQVQLNLLGRFTYVSSVVALSGTTDQSYRVETPSTKGSLTSTNGLLDFQTEKKYLTFSYWLLHEGWRRWSERVREVVEDVIGGISLKKTFTAKEFTDLFEEIRTRLEYVDMNGMRTFVNMREYILPDNAREEREALKAGGVDLFDLIIDSTLRNLLDETRDFIDSQDFTTVLKASLASIFARFNFALQPTFNPSLLSMPADAGAGNAPLPIPETQGDAIPLASLLSVVTRQVHLIINGVPNEYVESLSMVKELQAFSAIIYSSFNEELVNNQ
ncbi:peroxin [Lobosporangium transversale]|uniref:Peroxin-3 n=1 Tax=Lobosporangium transversale TaxID=64571 RepID=A0A1Y2GUQ4_9FUNG|nr:Peroxin-3 [Lobosporangium transversale]KAF9916911.1 peroxin [Lobosporangium transversale]ORZ21748.1 Peroxin-3 [Lobosporangium transversale]|eukprot:XP_021882999.1 Peroxin-3 [Lobosporangium transversale]